MNDEWTPGGVFGFTYLILFIPFVIYTQYLFRKNTHLSVITERVPALVELANLVIVIYVSALCISRIYVESIPCLANMWIGFVGTVLLFNVYLVRCFILFFKYNLTKRQIEFRALLKTRTRQIFEVDEEYDAATDNFFFRYKQFMKTKPILLIFTIISAILLIPCVVATIDLADEIGALNGDDCDRGWIDWVLSAYVFVYAIGFLWFAYHLRGIDDSFLIKQELKFTAIACGIAVIPWFLFNNTFEEVNNNIFPFSTLSLVVALTISYAFATLSPLYSVHNIKSLLRVPSKASITDFDEALRNKNMRHLFKEFLVNEFSVENLLFWEDVTAFRFLISHKSIPYNTIKTFALEIYHRYVEAGAPLEVNVSSDNKAKVIDAFVAKYGAASKRSSGRRPSLSLRRSRKTAKVVPITIAAALSDERMTTYDNRSNRSTASKGSNSSIKTSTRNSDNKTSSNRNSDNKTASNRNSDNKQYNNGNNVVEGQIFPSKSFEKLMDEAAITSSLQVSNDDDSAAHTPPPKLLNNRAFVMKKLTELQNLEQNDDVKMNKKNKKSLLIETKKDGTFGNVMNVAAAPNETPTSQSIIETVMINNNNNNNDSGTDSLRSSLSRSSGQNSNDPGMVDIYNTPIPNDIETVFDPCAKEVYKLMKTDPFIRFLQSDIFL